VQGTHRIIVGDCREGLRSLEPGSVHCVVTSPPYFGLRDYGVGGQIGLEPTPAEFVEAMVAVFAEVHRVLRDDGVCFVNLGDSYVSTAPGTRNASQPKGSKTDSDQWANVRPDLRQTGLKPKDMVGVPWRVAFALQEWGWYLRQDIIWAKPNPMPESVRDRCCKAHEYIFLLTKSPRYFWDGLAIAQQATGTANPKGGRLKTPKEALQANAGEGHAGWHRSTPDLVATSNRRSVWSISTQSFKGAHFATFPERIPELCIKAGTSERGCCPNCGKQWVRVVDKRRVPSRPGVDSKVYVDPAGSPYEQHSGTIIGNRDPQRHVTETVTTGWRQDCKCEAHEPVPSVVLDPFLGSGTTVQVATWLGRNGIGCELNPTYAAMAEERIATPPRFMTRKTPKKRRTKSAAQRQLF
jgi:DNA modification methylase